MISELHNIKALLNPLPGPEAQYKMAPAGRSRKNPLDMAAQARQGAVMLMVYQASEIKVLLMKRQQGGGVHAGQISLPGGRLEKGETFPGAAIRETHEETGVEVPPGSIAGELTPLYIPASNFFIRPFIALLDTEPVCKPCEEEVEKLIHLPVAVLQHGVTEMKYGSNMVPAYDCGNGDFIWGATAMILSEFSEILKRSGQPADKKP